MAGDEVGRNKVMECDANNRNIMYAPIIIIIMMMCMKMC